MTAALQENPGAYYQDINSLKDVLSNCVTTLIPDFITICAVVAIMFIKNAGLAAASLISLPLMAACIWYIQTRSHKRYVRSTGKNPPTLTLLSMRICPVSGLSRALVRKRKTMDTFRGLTKEHRDSFIHAVRLNDAIGSVIDFCWGLGTVSLYFAGILIIGVDKVSIGTFIAFGFLHFHILASDYESE